jgi:hypothetical protein
VKRVTMASGILLGAGFFLTAHANSLMKGKCHLAYWLVQFVGQRTIKQTPCINRSQCELRNDLRYPAWRRLFPHCPCQQPDDAVAERWPAGRSGGQEDNASPRLNRPKENATWLTGSSSLLARELLNKLTRHHGLRYPAWRRLFPHCPCQQPDDAVAERWPAGRSVFSSPTVANR